MEGGDKSAKCFGPRLMKVRLQLGKPHGVTLSLRVRRLRARGEMHAVEMYVEVKDIFWRV